MSISLWIIRIYPIYSQTIAIYGERVYCRDFKQLIALTIPFAVHKASFVADFLFLVGWWLAARPCPLCASYFGLNPGCPGFCGIVRNTSDGSTNKEPAFLRVLCERDGLARFTLELVVVEAAAIEHFDAGQL